MIEFPSHPEIEIRVLRIVLSHPSLLSVIPNLEVIDFWNPWHRLLWAAIRNVAEAGLPDDSETMIERCARWISTRPGALPTNAYGLVSDELSGIPNQTVFDPTIIRRDTVTPMAALRAELVAAQATLRFSRRARDQMTEQNPRRR